LGRGGTATCTYGEAVINGGRGGGGRRGGEGGGSKDALSFLPEAEALAGLEEGK